MSEHDHSSLTIDQIVESEDNAAFAAAERDSRFAERNSRGDYELSVRFDDDGIPPDPHIARGKEIIEQLACEVAELQGQVASLERQLAGWKVRAQDQQLRGNDLWHRARKAEKRVFDLEALLAEADRADGVHPIRPDIGF